MAVPTWLFKIAVRKLSDGKYEALAFEVPNTPIDIKSSSLHATMKKRLTTIRKIEQDTGFNFLNALPQAEQDRIETAKAKDVWIK